MAFFQCPKCKRIWQYPIEKCPYCFEKLERKRTKKAKVVSAVKVNVPSLFHSKVPYFILLLEDEEGKKWIQKSEREYKVGQEIEFEMAKNKEAVAVWKVNYDFFEAIEKVIEILDRLEIDEKTKILILPTLEKASHPYFRDNTSPQFLKATLQFLIKSGAKPENIKVAGQSFDQVDIGAKAQKSKLLSVCQEFKVFPLNLAETEFLKKGDLQISKEVFESDLILNLPILKIGKAKACQNLFYLLEKRNFLAQKYLFSEKEIFEKLKRFLPQTFTLAEAYHVQDEKGFTHYLNLVLASLSPQNLDRVFFEITKREKLPEILKDVKIEKIQILGRWKRV